MEQKKTLWIIAAVGIFLLVVLGGAAIVYRSSVKDTPIIASAKTTDKQAQAGWSNQSAQANNNEIQRPGFDSMQTNKVNEMYVVSENTTVYDLNKSAPAEAVQNQVRCIYRHIESLRFPASLRLPRHTDPPAWFPQSGCGQAHPAV